MRVLWFLPPWAWPVIILAGVVGFLHARWVYQRTVPAVSPRVRRWLVGLRTVAVTLLLLALAQPVLLRLLPDRQVAAVAVIVDDSASMGLADAEAGRADRWTTAWNFAAAVDSALSLLPGHPAVHYLRGNGRRPLETTTVAEAPADEPRAVGTDLGALLAQVRQRFLGQPLRALVLLSDGNTTTGEIEATADVTPSGPPTWLVGVGDPIGPADRLLADLRYPETVYQGESVTVELAVADRFQLSPGAAGPLHVRLRQGEKVLAEAVRPASGEVQRFSLEFAPREVGLQLYTLDVSPLANESFLANNEVTLVIDVRKDRARVVLLASRPSWDARFLAQAAVREPRLALTIVYPGSRGPVLADSLTAWQRPQTAAQWQTWDGVILLGPPTGLVDDGGRTLAQAVREGLGLCVLVTEGEWPAPIADLLPVAPRMSAPATGEYFLEAAPEAGRHPLLIDVSQAGTALASLGSLPPLRSIVPVEPRDSGQTVLQGRRQGSPDSVLPVLVAGAADHGRVVWFGGSRLWELAFWEPPGEAAPAGNPVRQLLRNLLLWTALGEQEGGISLLGRRMVYQEGEQIHVEARWLDLRGVAVVNRPFSLRLEGEAGTAVPARMFTMTPDVARPGVAGVDLPPLPPGRYRLTPAGGGGDPTEGQSRTLVVVPATVEQTQVRQDRRHLRQLAAREGARYVDGHDAQPRQDVLRALAGLDLAPEIQRRQWRWDLWASWPYLTLVVALLAAEWVIRRRHGML